MTKRPSWSLRSTLATVALAAIVGHAGPALADEAVDACGAAAVNAQKLRRAGKLREAKPWFDVCSQSVCREDIAADCKTWRDEVDREIVEAERAAAPAPPRLSAPDPPYEPPLASHRPTPPLVYAVGALAIAGVAGFGVTAGVAYGDWSSSNCDVGCVRDDAERVGTKLVIADVFLAVGVVAAAVTTVLYLTRPHRTLSSSNAPNAGSMPGGAVRF